jgi:putative nucleotidyltransferase with HDIG domain
MFVVGGTPSRSKLRAAIPRRLKVGPLTAILLALGFAIAVTPVIRIDLWLTSAGSLDVKPGEPSPVTVRVPPFAEPAPGGGAIVIARGEIADAYAAHTVAVVRARTPHGVFGDLAYFAVVLTLTAIYTMQLRRSNRGRHLRTQVVLLGGLLVFAVGVKTLMLLTSISVLAMPVSLLALATAMALDREAGVATGVLASVVVGLLVPFDIGITVILLVQALTASLLLPDRIKRRWRVSLTAGIGAAITGALAYGVVHYLTRGTAPVDELSRLGASSWLAAASGGVIAALLAMPSVPLLQMASGEITDGHLISLEDLSHPLLKQISEKSPGTWQHSLAMANMAEIAANAIGANGRLVRVGAYFHDLGKSLQPKYFIENVESGEQSPHDRLPPEVSCDAIFAHVTEGIALARRHRLPERIIDFMHMHHGDGVLEYFWAKCQDQGNPGHLSTEDFRYPGVPPQSRETAILAICDAVEAASRTLRRPDQQAISSLVQRIVYGKLHLGQLDESGLSMADLRKINDSLKDTIKHAHHGRIEYPWQREEREAEEKEAATVHARPGAKESITQRIMEEPRLDSLDAPRPPWAAGGTGPTGRGRTSSPPPMQGDAGGAATVPISTPPTMSLRPRTYADSVDVAHAATAQQRAQMPPPDMGTMTTGDVRIAHPVPTEPGKAPPPMPPQRRAGSQPAVPPEPEPETLPDEDVAFADPSVPYGTMAPPPPDGVAEAVAPVQPISDEPSAPVLEIVPDVVAAAEVVASSSLPNLVAAEPPRWSGTFAAAAEDALEVVHPPEPAPASAKWGSRLADRIDAMLDDEVPPDAIAPTEQMAAEPAPAEHLEVVEESASHDAIPTHAEPITTVRRAPPPPPGRARRPTQEVDGSAVEATYASGPIAGPPPATRAAPAPARGDTDSDRDPSDDEVTVVPARPQSSMLPPRARTHGKPRE